MEIGIEEPAATPQILMKQKDQILNLLSKHKMSAVGHTAYWVQFGSSHEKARRGWVEEAKEMITAASEIKISLLNFHFYGGHGRTAATESARKRFVENFVKSLRELNKFASRKKVTLMLENVPIRADNGYGVKEYSYVIREVSGMLVHLDVAHAFIEGGMSRIHQYLRDFSDTIGHVHLHDNHGDEDEHLPLGAGTIDFGKVIHWLKEIDYNGTITFEVFTSRDDAVRSREIFKKSWGNSR